MKIFATTDTHFGHDRLITIGAGRPVNYAKRILRSIMINEGDILIHCGDFCIGEDEKWIKKYMEAANFGKGFKKKILIKGNHDHRSDSWYLARGFDMVCESMLCKYFGKQILFTHMPAQKDGSYWSPHFPPDINMHGHLHGDGHRGKDKPDIYDRNYYYDLAPDIHNYEIVNIQKICLRHQTTK